MALLSASNPFADFELLVSSRSLDGYEVTVMQSPAGDARALCQLDPANEALQALIANLVNPDATEATFLQLGDLLFTALFTGDIATLYRASLGMVRAQGKQLRIRLTFEPPELATLPWEFLHDAQEDTFLAISAETPLVRYVPLPMPSHSTIATPPLRIIVAIASPKDAPPLNTQREQSIIQDALAEGTAQGRLQLHFVEHATVAAIGQAMRAVQPHIFHFIGHTTFADDQAWILLEREDGNARPINERTFREFFTGCPDTHLAVLNACQTATTAAHQGLVGLAPRLLQRQLAAVVAMQYPILDTTALIFAREFYRSLALGYPVEAAITEARRGIYLEVGSDTYDWGIPTLFLRAQNGQLFAIAPDQKATHQASSGEEDSTVQARLADLHSSESAVAASINTAGGTYVGGAVQAGRDFIGHDKVIQGDEVQGDKVVGHKTEVHIAHVEPGGQVIVGDVQITQTLPPELPSPPEPTHPPIAAGFVGRETELTYYTEQLQTTHFTAICGMAGVGKSAMAAVLAQREAPANKVFWHSFHAAEGFEPLLWQLAGFLAHQGQRELWQMLHTAWQARRELLPPATLFNYLLQLLRGQGYLICLDDFQFVDEDPVVIQLVERLRTLLATGELSLMLTARHLPDFLSADQYIPLNGLSSVDMRKLLADRGVSLPDPLLVDLHEKTEGNVQLLILAIEALRHTADSTRLVARLVESVDIERYLMHEVDARLSSAERTVMSGVALLLGYFGTREALEAIVGGDSIRRTLHDLSNRYLLVVRETESGRVYGQHATLQAFYYDLLGSRERVAMHQRAGNYYAHIEPDALSAARHYQCAGDFSQAATVVAPERWAIINQGQGQALRQVLEHFTAAQVDGIQWAQVNVARGELYTLLGESALARQSFATALDSTSIMPASPARHQVRMASYSGMGQLLEHESPQQALNWLQRGLAEVAGGTDEEAAALHIRIGSVQIAGSEYAAALQSLQKGLQLLPTTPNSLRTSALIDIGNIYASQGDRQRGYDYYSQALTIAEQLHDNFTVLAIRSNLAIDKEIAGDWPGAIADYQQALLLAERLGDVVEQAKLANSLGLIYTKLGQDEAAAAHLARAIDLARVHNNREDLLYALHSLADLYVRQGDLGAATTCLTEAEQLAQELAIETMQAEINCLWAQIYLHHGEPQPALGYAQCAVEQAHDLGLQVEEGKFRRVLGQAQAANQQPEPALVTMAESLALLANRDPYEAACTQMAWGQLLVMHGDVAQGQRLLQEARAVFGQLGAQRDLLGVNETLCVNA